MPAMRCLIAGDTGFVASYLLPALSRQHPDLLLYGISRQVVREPAFLLAHYSADLTDTRAVERVVAEVTPDLVVNLSSFSSVFESWADPIACHQVNYIGTLNLCLALVKHAPAARMVHISSLEVYGGSNNPAVSHSEDSAINPKSPYAVSKAASELILQQYGISHNLHYTILRPSNHTGPGRKPQYVLSGFARQITEIRYGLREPILRVGNLQVHRDFLDVRDVVRAYVSVLLHPNLNKEVLNVCSGKVYSLAELLDLMIRAAGVNVEIRVNPALYRPVNMPYSRGGSSRISSKLGWTQKIPIEDTLRDLLNYWDQSLNPGASAHAERPSSDR